MKICYIGDGGSIHMKRWAKAMAGRGHEVHLLSFRGEDIDGVNIHIIPTTRRDRNKASPKSSYVLRAPLFRKKLLDIRPHIVHAHYATGYATTAVLAGVHPLIISTWGSDIFDEPARSYLYRSMVESNLRQADYITATSRILAEETKKYTDKDVDIIAFGVDTRDYSCNRRYDREKITVGIVKSLEEKYGVEYLIRAFASMKTSRPTELLIVGGGSLKDYLKELCRELKIDDRVRFAGRIPHSEVPYYLSLMDIFVAPSILDSETFGVAVVEAEASGLPVIVSNVGGLPEVVVDGVTGFLVPPRDTRGLARCLHLLIENDRLRENMGRAGREFVEEYYEWEKNVDEMEKLYRSIKME